MKKKLSLLLLFISTIISAQVTEVIPNQFIAASEAVVLGNDIYILTFGQATTGESEFYRVDLSDPAPSVQDVFLHPDALNFTIDGSVSYIFGLFGDVTQTDINDFSSNTTTLTTISELVFDSLIIGDFLYFTSDNDSLSRIDLNNPTTPETVISLNFPQGLALIGDELFIAITGDDTIGKINITDATPTIEIVATGFDEPSSIVASGSTLYIGELGAGSRVLSIDTSITNPAPIELATIGGNLVGFSIFENDLYFTNSTSGSLLRIDDVLTVEDQGISSNEIKMFPNPSNGTIQFSSTGINNLQEFTVYDLTGRVIHQSKYSSSIGYIENTPININTASGTYIVKITTTTGTETQKLIIK